MEAAMELSSSATAAVESSHPQKKEEDMAQASSFKERESNVSFFKLLAFADTTDMFLMFFGTLGACVHGAALPVFFVIFGRLIDSLGCLSGDTNKLASEVGKNALQLLYLGLVVMASSWIEVACWMQTGERQATCLRLKYFHSVLNQDISFFDTSITSANVLNCISRDTILVQDAIGDKVGHCLHYLARFLVGFALGFSSVWQLTLLTLAVVPLMVIAGGAYTVTMAGLSKKGEAAYAEAAKVAEEVISQIRTVHSFVGEDKASKAYSTSLETSLKLGRKSGMAKGLGVGITYGLLFGAWALLLWYAGVLVRHQATNGGKAFTTILNVVISGISLGQAAPNLSAFAEGRAAASNLMSMIEKGPSVSVLSENGVVLPNVAGNIAFCGVTFSYPSRAGLIFEDLSLSIPAGSTFAIVGPSGSGKSTILSLVERFYDPTSGVIMLDGHDLKSLKMKWLRSQIGLVSQEPALFATTIAENISYGNESSDIQMIMEAAKAANADSFIRRLPENYSTQVGYGGTQLSGGQKQRIAIARAVLRNPKILLLDEATSALDTESEHLVQQALDTIMLGRTTIIIAHRLSTVRNANCIAVLQNGKVVECGTHEQLISTGKDGVYASLLSLQISANDELPSKTLPNQTKNFLKTPHFPTCPTSELDYPNPKFKDLQSQSDIPHSEKKNSNATPYFWKLVRLNTPEWRFAVLGSLGAILAGMEGPLFALGITHCLTTFYSPDKLHVKHEIERISLIFVGAAVVTLPIYLLQHYFYTWMGERLTARVRSMMFSVILRNEVGWFDLDENNCGSLTSHLAADATLVRSALADRISTIVQNISLTVTAFTIAFMLTWRMAAVVIATFPLLIGASIGEQLFLRGFGGDYNSAYFRASAVAREAINNIRTIVAFCAEDRVSALFALELYLPRKRSLLRGNISGLGYGMSQFFMYCSYAIALWYASLLMRHGKSDFGDIMKSFMVLVITALGVAETLALAPDIVKGSQALASVFNILERKTLIEPDDPSSEVVTEVSGDIELKNVGFRYPVRPEVVVFDDLNLKVEAGCTVAIVGQSGSGKSSVIALLMRFYDPISGCILIDGHDIRGMNLKSYRKRVGLVQQEPALFSTTIYENILYGRDGASEVEVLRASKAAHAHGFISCMPDGYNTRVGERGVLLSGGQKQRVAIARAILKDPSILLLDEATSALDATSENLVQRALDKLMEGRTTVVVAHRLSTIMNADKIVVLENGKVKESGSHEELTNMVGGTYTQLVSLQQRTVLDSP
ncbi:ABC transporter B family member 13 isoform X1 [Amborella trichopoda]|uniref:Uncharacterized protein n=2 Tax=Amborella trichopoda TaxID=13333 RepID=U5D9Z2_AMBTC|nr:ABC transporter B family member 13 isoform X1 [Amborella trichopoda]ERN18247.1 hypothetical protein AMTR_s00055p00102180 [Amborella trichopoda]|eukprot:XP_006856780.3 ABC transporter B family member 13 isoform X1 [Amborella trichopoda]